MQVTSTCRVCGLEFTCTDAEDGNLCPTCTAQAQRASLRVMVIEVREVPTVMDGSQTSIHCSQTH